MKNAHCLIIVTWKSGEGSRYVTQFQTFPTLQAANSAKRFIDDATKDSTYPPKTCVVSS